MASLFESSNHELIVYSPLSLENFPFDEGELWIANVDGTNAQKLADFAPAYVNWSNDGQWFVTGQAVDGLPGQVIHYLGRTNGTFFETLQSITGVDSFYLNGLFPEFSPDGQQLLFAGTLTAESREAEDYRLFSLNLNSFESQEVTRRLGLFQWAENSEGIYVLDGAFTPFDPSQLGSVRQASLYLVEFEQNPSREYLIASGIPYNSFTGFGSWNWAYSSVNQAIAYVGYNEYLELGILELSSVD